MPAPTAAHALHALLAIPPIVSSCVLGLYLATELITPVVALFWLAVLSLAGTLVLVRRIPLLWALSAALSVGLLTPATRSALTWTTWSIGGFAP